MYLCNIMLFNKLNLLCYYTIIVSVCMCVCYNYITLILLYSFFLLYVYYITII